MSTCELCGQPMPPGEEMFKFHGYSGPCPVPPQPQPLTGYREFHCEVCGSSMRVATRDHASPSGENCLGCGTFVRPVRSSPAKLPVDANGNLAFPDS